jgi:hypothetical protein
MIRSLLAAVVLAACALALAPSCNATVTEGCLEGTCPVEGTGGGCASPPMPDGSMTADTCPMTLQSGDFPCDVFAVIHTNCNPCHANPKLNGAPFPLLTFDDTQQPFTACQLIFQRMYDQTRPSACPRMPLGGMLDTADYATLSNWLLMCAPPLPAGTGCGCLSEWSGNGCTPL